MNDFVCRFCSSRELQVLFPARDRLCGRPGTFWVTRCHHCRVTQTHPVPADLSDYYPPDSYGPHQNSVPPSLPRSWGSDGYHLPPLPPDARVLEIGCGRGDFVRLGLRKGWTMEAVETAPDAARLARSTGVPIHEQPLERLSLPARSFDAIFAWMALEHLPDPPGALREVHRLLRPRGLFVFSVPDAGSWEFRAFGPNWYALDCPRHLTHFDRSTLTRLLQAARLSPVRWKWQRNPLNIVASLGLLLEQIGTAPRLAQKFVRFPERPPRTILALLYPLACVLAAIRQGGRMTVLARKGAA